jgi:hypothetical protein
MRSARSHRLRKALAAAVFALPPLAHAYGPEGHLIAGIAAEQRLCTAARAEIVRLGAGDSLAALGLWADRIRADPTRRETAPWHYINIDDGASLRGFRHAPEGDVLEAIVRFERVLADRTRPDRVRAEALKFLAHFIVDIHQPLHVGRAADRGGNTIEFRLRGRATNLHQVWDSAAIEAANLSVSRYARALRPEMATLAAAGSALDPLTWAEESFALRGAVYAFEARDGELDAAYVQRAATITRRRLAQAALRLAGTLNALFCG